jgi:large subunit ribosomal protein L7Ae
MPAAKKAAPAKKAAAPAKKATAAKKEAAPAKKQSKFTARPKNFGIGQAVPYKRDISRFMRWPRFVTMQRKKRVLQRRLKTPPALNQFNKTTPRSTRTELFKLLKEYKPETRQQRRARAKATAEAKKANPKKTVATKAPLSLVTGLQEVTRLVERKKAKLVVIANDVDPIELVMWLPALCRAQKVPYAIVKDKARLGQVIGTKTSAVVAVKAVKSEHEGALKNLTRAVNAKYLNGSEKKAKEWGKLQLSLRSRAAARKKRASKTQTAVV